MTLLYNPATSVITDTSNPIKVRNYGPGMWFVWLRSPTHRYYESTSVGPFSSFDAAWAFLDRRFGAYA